ncbi:MAG: CoA ester lyase [Rhodobacteraceae bacterium]|nr:CoA ester lyase [Paracoccaceae bacterium]
MSFVEVRETRARMNRSELAVPGSQPRFFEKALKSAADVVFLDLEDSVAVDQKAQARRNIIEVLNDLDWSGKTVSVRINGLDTPYMYRDVVDVVERAGQALDLIMIPKVGKASDVYALDMLVTQIEQAMGHSRGIGFELIIETALGMQNLPEIAAASQRIESLHFGVADYAASTRARTTGIGGANRDYAMLTDADENRNRSWHWNDMWHYASSRIVVTARANGLRPIDGPFGDFSDAQGFAAAAGRAASLGFEGKWAIHPSQIALANTAMSPTEAELAQARRILEAMKAAEREGRGAATLDGKLIDYASIRQAQAMIDKVDSSA